MSKKSRDMQILKVDGDHCVGIFAKECIEACVDLIYDYGYAHDQAPVWALKPEDFAQARGAEGPLFGPNRYLITCITIIIE